MRSKSSNISREEAKDALVRSGYLLESRVESVLRDAGYYVEANASYQDPSTSKSRETDIYAISAKPAGPTEYDYVFPVLIAECVNNDQPLVLLTKEPMVPFLHRDEVRVSGLPVKFPESEEAGTWVGFSEYLGLEKFHHYCRGRIATQFCSFVQKKGGSRAWTATHEEDHFDSFKKLTDALDYFGRRHFANYVLGDREHVNIQIYYPILILQGELWDARATKRSVTLRRARHLQFRRSSAAAATEEDYQLDVLEERYLPKYLEIVDQEADRIARLLRRRRRAVRSAIDTIVRNAKAATSPEKAREALEL
jgi:galactitol-specific phosphotransferase system IIB component